MTILFWQASEQKKIQNTKQKNNKKNKQKRNKTKQNKTKNGAKGVKMFEPPVYAPEQ